MGLDNISLDFEAVFLGLEVEMRFKALHNRNNICCAVKIIIITLSLSGNLSTTWLVAYKLHQVQQTKIQHIHESWER